MIDPISVTVYQRRLESIAEEMSIVLRKSSYSPNIKERADFSCAIFDSQGKLVAQAEAIPVHLGSMGFVAQPILEKYGGKWKEGDAIIVNSPRAEFGGTHLPDITLVSPVFHNGNLEYIVANRAHHADVGGMVPGSLPGNSTEIFQEGIIIPPVPLYQQGVENEAIMMMILENVRTPDERRGDLRAQYSSLTLGVRRLKEYLYSLKLVPNSLNEALLNYSDKGTRVILETLPRGMAEFEDYLDSDGNTDNPVKIRCRFTIGEDGLTFDFTGSATQIVGNANAPRSITTAACYYVTRLITGRVVPTNEGCFRSVNIIAPENSVVNPSRFAATSSANTETSSRIVDTILGAVAKLLQFPAASQGTMNNVLLGGSVDGKSWTIYETIGGGTGATPSRDGTSAIHSHMTNTENTPVEALEIAYPLRILEYSIRVGSGGDGLHRGGDGIVRKIELIDDATVSLQTERRKFAPWGLNEGEDGECGRNRVYRGDEVIDLGGRVSMDLKKGDILEILTPGGGGYGKKTS